MPRKPKRSKSTAGARLEAGERAAVMRAATIAAEAYGVFRPLIFATTRSRIAATTARQVAMYLANCSAGINRNRLARAFGRDPSTIAHNVALIEDRRDDQTFDDMIAGLERRFSNPA